MASNDDINEKSFDKGGINANPFLEAVMRNRKSVDAATTSSSSSSSYSYYYSSSEERNSLYDDEELLKVLSIHKSLKEKKEDETQLTSIQQPTPSLHDLVVRTIEQDNPDGNANPSTSTSTTSSSSTTTKTKKFEFDSQTKSKIQSLKAIACDVDGTIVYSDSQTKHPRVHPRTKLAIRQIMSSNNNNNYPTFFLATGKSRYGAINSLGPELQSLFQSSSSSGVYLQGLYCIDSHQRVVFERKVDREVVKDVEQLCRDCHVDGLVGYDGDDLYTTSVDENDDIVSIVKDFHRIYREAMPRLLPQKQQNDDHNRGKNIIRPLFEHKPLMHKLVLIHNNTQQLTNDIRPQLEELARRHGVIVTQALPEMLEILPPDCSKGNGVERLCESMGVDPMKELMALGDAENDVEMLRLASLGVAMGNACQVAKEGADFVMEERVSEGGVGSALELFVFS